MKRIALIILGSFYISAAIAQGTENSYMLNPQRGSVLPGTGTTYDSSLYQKGPTGPTTAGQPGQTFDSNGPTPPQSNTGTLGVGSQSNLNSLGSGNLGVGNSNSNLNSLGNSSLGVGNTTNCARTGLTNCN
jgi:hypothetical protein